MTTQPRLFTAPKAKRPPLGRTRRGADATVRALRELGRLEDVDTAVVVAQRVAADNVDAAERAREQGDGSAWVVAGSLRVYLAATGALYSRVGMLDPDQDDELWRELSSPLGDPPTA